MKLLNQIAAFDSPSPHLILTLQVTHCKAPDLYEIIDEAHRMGMDCLLLLQARPTR